MSGKLDQSLDEILTTRRAARRTTRNRRGAGARGVTTNGAATAPVGGVRKSTRQPRPAVKSAPAAAAQGTGESKIIVSGMPPDVTEANIKEYFHQSAGPVKKVLLTYNQNGTSRGIATIIFKGPGTAAKAARELNGLLIDKRPIKIEVVVDAQHAPQAPAPKSFSERVALPKSKPKPVTAAKVDKKRDGRRQQRGRGAGRPKPKTAEELDAEMQDYFESNPAPAANGGAAAQAPAPAQEDVMDDI